MLVHAQATKQNSPRHKPAILTFLIDHVCA